MGIVDRATPIEAEVKPLDEGGRNDADVLEIQSTWHVDVEDCEVWKWDACCPDDIPLSVLESVTDVEGVMDLENWKVVRH